MTVERDWFWFWFWFYYALWLASVFTLVLVLRQSSENRSNMGRFCLKARRLDEKRADEIDVRKYPFSGSVMRILPFLVNFVLKFKLGVSSLVKNAPVE